MADRQLAEQVDQIDWSSFADTEQNMGNLMGKIVGITSFLSTHNSRTVRRGEKDFDMKGFDYFEELNPLEKNFDYEKELVAMEQSLNLIRMAHYKTLEMEEM